jgi:predicted AAA+ superfamily ATPase
MMKRAALDKLLAWKANPRHKPLLLRGARQVGKTYLVTELGKTFENCVTINFELEPEYKTCFSTLKPEEILRSIALLSNQVIRDGHSLLFLDEIQECPPAILALRYFKEKRPDLHVIGAGSLLEFALSEEDFRMPVGRVDFMHLQPLSFREFLNAHHYDQLNNYLSEITLEESVNESVHQKLLICVKEYLALGGMPEVHEDYLVNHSFQECQKIQTSLLATYRRDFGKYAAKGLHEYLESVFTSAPHLIGQQVKYVDFNREYRSRDLKKALELLEKAGVLQRVFATQASGLPLDATLNEKKFKLIYLDVGLANRNSKVDINTLLQQEIDLINSGHITEQFVGQELLAYSPIEEEPQLYYWNRDKVGSQAEVDFVMTYRDKIIPIEVKAGVTGRLKSLRIFMEEKKSILGVRISQKPLQYVNGILSVPYYLISELPRLLEGCLGL